MTRMPSLRRPAWRLPIAVATVASALVAASALAQTPPAPVGVSVTIQPADDGAPVTISTADVPQGEMNTTYRVGSRSIVVENGVSLRQLIDEVGAVNYAEIEIPRPDGTKLVMSKEQVDDIKPAGFYTDDQGVTHFIGPTGSNGSVASQDHFAVSGEITLTQLREPGLEVTISPKSKKIEPGGTVRFRAKVTGDEDGESVTYTWGIKGGKQTKGGPGFTQKFPSKDDVVHQFLVAVRIEGSEVSYTDVAKITVGDPRKSEDGQTGSGDVGDDGDDGAGSTGSIDGGIGSSSGADSTYTPAPYTPSTAPLDPLGLPPLPPSAQSNERSKSPDAAASSPTVEGNLLADVSDPPPSNILESAAAAAREGKQRDDDSAADGAGVSEAALSIAGVLALLGLGAGIETRQGRLPRWRLPSFGLPRRGA